MGRSGRFQAGGIGFKPIAASTASGKDADMSGDVCWPTSAEGALKQAVHPDHNAVDVDVGGCDVKHKSV